jgi:hypothetical protein
MYREKGYYPVIAEMFFNKSIICIFSKNTLPLRRMFKTLNIWHAI